MSTRTDNPPVVPPQSAAGPENPPCPACTNPLFPWVAEPWREAEAVLRCEVCGLGVAQAGGSAEEARAAAVAAVAETGRAPALTSVTPISCYAASSCKQII